MSFKSLHHVLGGLQNQYQRQKRSQLQGVLQCWAEIVGPVVAVQTRPLNIYQGVLKVATSSAVWAQNLVFERQRILEKLNRTPSLQGAEQITDIRFSPARWHEVPLTSFPGEQLQDELWQAHPSLYLGVGSSGTASPPPRHNSAQNSDLQESKRKTSEDAITAFRQWSVHMKGRSRQLPLCPECRCPTPPGELHRWSVCAICAAKGWS
ncbi:MAG: DUF721 domain-containing protein [Leptolyngbyaceae cyanobacterium bins.302]|nr:DUF721 domain-containing protein [Leptolyngbyaceae cyanobacterium bins.302]